MASTPALAISNIYAPPWMCQSPSVANYDDVQFDLPCPIPTTPGTFPVITVPAASFSLGNTVQLDSDFDFLIREWQFIIVPNGDTFQPSDLRVRIRDTEGRLITSDYIQAQNLTGQWALVAGMRKGGVITFDFYNANAENSIQVQVVMRGWKRAPCPGKPALISDYKPMWTRYAKPLGGNIKVVDYEYYFTFTSSGAQDLLRLPLQFDNDSEFLLRGIQGDWSTANNDVSALGNVAATFYQNNNPLIQTPGVTVPWGSPNAGQMRETIWSNGGGAPAPIYPEILVKRGGVLQLDLSFGAAATVRFSLRGVKLYRTECAA